MSEEEFERYLDSVSSRLGLSAGRREEIREELRAHLDERWEGLSACDGPREQRIERVLAEFGPPDRLAEGIARPYRRRLSRIAGVVAASLLFSLLLHGRFWSVGPSGGTGPLLAGTGGSVLVGGEGPASGGQDHAFRALQQRVPRLAFDDEPLEEVFTFLRQTTRANIWVNWNALEADGVEKDTPISMQLKDVPMGRVLELLCTVLNVDGSEVRFGHSRNVIEISTAEYLRSPALDMDTVQVVYDVRAILDAATAVLRNNPPPQPKDKQSRAEWLAEIQAEAAEELTGVITASINPEGWNVNGGRDSIEYFASLLVVRAPVVTQAKVADLLEQLRNCLATEAADHQTSSLDPKG